MKSISLFSGGKDSFLAAVIAMEQGFEIVTTVTVDSTRDSMMFHVPNNNIAGDVASLLGLKNIRISEEGFREEIGRIVHETGAQALISGAIASNYQKSRIERLCTELCIISYTPLWLLNQETELDAVISSGIKAMLISLSADGLGEEYLGGILDGKLVEDLKKIRERHGINISGEGGEYESLVVSYLSNKLQIKSFKDTWTGNTGTRIVTV